MLQSYPLERIKSPHPARVDTPRGQKMGNTMFGLQFVQYGTRILHSKDLDDMQAAILDEEGIEGGAGGSQPMKMVKLTACYAGHPNTDAPQRRLSAK
jgi:hypothetical protein